MRTSSKVMGLALAVAVAGCEAETTGPAGEGEVVVGVQGSSNDQLVASRSLSIGGGGSAAAEGSVGVSARVYLQNAVGEWVEVTNGASEQTVRADGSDGVQVFAGTGLDAGTYGRVRVEFDEVRANPNGEVRLSLPLVSGEISVDLGVDGRVVIEREVEVRVRSGVQTQLTMNLNADAWLNGGSGGGEAVAEGAFQGAVSIVAGS